jgi:hypothetical protein
MARSTCIAPTPLATLIAYHLRELAEPEAETVEGQRSLPRSEWTLQLRAHGPRGERRIGPYTMLHTPWQELGGA